ncbi:MAG: hypothetical protein EPN33_12915 [Acidobacteria bacterium]|nr:MAG: hypothetical protein EPN33_12915 [Acidobacteriota bacterium]
MNLIFVDAGSGALQYRTTVAAYSPWARIVFAARGKFILWDGSDLTLYGPKAVPLRRAKLPQRPWTWDISASPDHVLLNSFSYSRTAGKTWEWFAIRTDTLKWQSSTDGPTAQVAGPNVIGGSSGWGYSVRRNGGGWTDVPGLQPDRGIIGFANPNLMILFGALLDTTTGIVRPVPGIGSACAWPGNDFSYESSGGKRLAFGDCPMVGAHPAFDVGGHSVWRGISIFDAPSYNLDHRLVAQGASLRGDVRQALSSDGHRFAILHGTVIQMFILPPLPGPHPLHPESVTGHQGTMRPWR